MPSHKKPKGEIGSVQIGDGSGSYRKIAIPDKKDEIERWVLDNALAVARARGLSLYDLKAPPQQNQENHFDFTLKTTKGVEYLDLMEVGLMEITRGFEHAPTSYSIDEMVNSTLDKIQKKSAGYGQPTRPLHLLLYTTDFRFQLTEDVASLVAGRLTAGRHVFTTIVYVSPLGGSSGAVASLHPLASEASVHSKASGHVVFGDIRHPTVETDGTVTIPAPLPLADAAWQTSSLPVERRIWIPPPLCGCELEIQAQWPRPGAYDCAGRLISDHHPVSGTIQHLRLHAVCAEHLRFGDGPRIDETYAGSMVGYLHRPPSTQAEKLYVGLSRFTGQVWQPDTCTCRIYQVHDRTNPSEAPVSMKHPRLTRHCSAHSSDSEDHRQATENNLRKSHTVNWLVAEFGVSTGRLRWAWTVSRQLLLHVTGLSGSQRQRAQLWCDERFGTEMVQIAVDINGLDF